MFVTRLRRENPRVSAAPSPFSPLTAPWPAWAVAIAFGAGYWLLMTLSFLHWNLATGLLFLALWLMPRRYWTGVVLATMLTRSLNGVLIGWRNSIDDDFLRYWHDPTAFVLGNLFEPFPVVVVVALILFISIPTFLSALLCSTSSARSTPGLSLILSISSSV